MLFIDQDMISARSLSRRGNSTLHMENIVTSSRIIMKKKEHGVICVDAGMLFVPKTCCRPDRLSKRTRKESDTDSLYD